LQHTLRNIRFGVASTVIVAIFALAVSAASAAEHPARSATLGITVDPIAGEHVEPGGTTRFDGTPLLTIEGSARLGHLEVFAEGLPPVAPITSSGKLGSLSTTLSFVFSSARFYLDGQHVSLGLGETLYHQVTLRSPSSERDTSNLTGLRYELRGIQQYGRHQLSLAVEATPVMRGGVRVEFARQVQFDGEQASQMELRLRDDWRAGSHVDVVLGVRYINFAAAYVSDGSLADRNKGVALTVGLLGRIGR